jgi:hypothetical protein
MIFMWSLVLVLMLLDLFIPNSFYLNFINQEHVFKDLLFIIVFAGLIGSIICKFTRKED